MKLQEKKLNEVDVGSRNDIFKIKKVYYKCLSNTLFIRKTVRITNIENSDSFDKIIVGYTWKIGKAESEKVLNVKFHKNSKKNVNPYYRIEGSVLD